jgi:putative spermidine/putrescine transport system ATP-binding protein
MLFAANKSGADHMTFLDLQHVSKKFASVTAVENFSLTIEKGKLVSFLGPSGCGKTTTLRMIAGFEQPDSGTITLDRQDITVVPPNRRDIGMVFQSYALFPNMTVQENIAFGLQMKRVGKSQIQKRTVEVLEMIRLTSTADRYPHQLSGGQQQRVALARALAVQPRVLLLDEPLSALDAEVRLALRGEIRRIQSELGITTIYVTHDQEEALSISDVVVVMNAGVIEQVGTPVEIYRKPQTHFVATFIGTANQFTGKAVGSHTVLCEGFQLHTMGIGEVAEGGDVVVLVRPEAIQVQTQKEDQTGWNCIPGSVETITFHGAVTRLGVNVFGQRVVADVTEANTQPISLNEKVWLAFPQEACQVMTQVK